MVAMLKTASEEDAKKIVQTRQARIGQAIRDAREALGWSRLTVAYRAGVASTTVEAVENGGNVKTATLLVVAEVVGVVVEVRP